MGGEWLAGRHQISSWRGSAWLAAIMGIMSIMSITKHRGIGHGLGAYQPFCVLVLVPLGALWCGAQSLAWGPRLGQ